MSFCDKPSFFEYRWISSLTPRGGKRARKVRSATGPSPKNIKAAIYPAGRAQ